MGEPRVSGSVNKVDKICALVTFIIYTGSIPHESNLAFLRGRDDSFTTPKKCTTFGFDHCRLKLTVTCNWLTVSAIKAVSSALLALALNLQLQTENLFAFLTAD